MPFSVQDGGLDPELWRSWIDMGLPGLSMRTLASALGTGAMTLYNYVAAREELDSLVSKP